MEWTSQNFALIIEWSGSILGVLYIYFATENKQWCWPIGIVGSGISVWLFYDFSQLYSEALLNVYYVVMGFYGWWNWHRQDEVKNKPGAAIQSMSVMLHVIIVVLGIAGAFGLYYLINTVWSDAQKPLFDAFTTIFAFLATWLTAKRFLENWIYWVIIDGCSVFLFISRDLYIYAGLMGLYTVIAVVGYIRWRKLRLNQ